MYFAIICARRTFNPEKSQQRPELIWSVIPFEDTLCEKFLSSAKGLCRFLASWSILLFENTLRKALSACVPVCAFLNPSSISGVIPPPLSWAQAFITITVNAASRMMSFLTVMFLFPNVMIFFYCLDKVIFSSQCSHYSFMYSLQSMRRMSPLRM